MRAKHTDTMQAWLTTRLSEHLGLAPEDIDVRTPFTEYGLDSMVGVFLAGDLEAWLGLQLSPTVLWDYPTPETLAHFLAAELWRQGSAIEHTANAPELTLEDLALDPAEAAALLASLATLSDADVDQLWRELVTTPGRPSRCEDWAA
jgi:acyl carrier protein